MQKAHYALAIIGVLVIGLAAACSAPVPAAGPTIPPSVPTFAAASVPTEAPGSVPVLPTVAAPAGSLAPTCQATTSCEALNAEQIQLDCVKKVPYTNVLMPSGTTYEVVDKSGSFICDESSVVVNGKKVVSCRGPELQSFELKLSNPSCGAESLVTGTGQCQEGYGYDAAQQCCAPVNTGTGGPTTVRVNLGGCPIPKPNNP